MTISQMSTTSSVSSRRLAQHIQRFNSQLHGPNPSVPECQLNLGIQPERPDKAIDVIRFDSECFNPHGEGSEVNILAKYIYWSYAYWSPPEGEDL